MRIICKECGEEKEIEKPDCHCTGCCWCYEGGPCRLETCEDCIDRYLKEEYPEKPKEIIRKRRIFGLNYIPKETDKDYNEAERIKKDELTASLTAKGYKIVSIRTERMIDREKGVVGVITAETYYVGKKKAKEFVNTKQVWDSKKDINT